MTNRVLLILACASTALAPSLAARAQSTDRAAAQSPPSWRSPSLVDETVVGPNGAITTRTALLANAKWGITETNARRARHRRRVCAARLGHCEQLRDRSPRRLDHRRHRRLHPRGDRDASGTRRRGRPQDQGRRDPPDPLALRRRHRRVARRRTEDLGTRVPGPQPQHLNRHQRLERHLPGTCDRPVRRVPSAKRPRRLSQQARLHAREAAGRVQLQAAHASSSRTAA